MNLKNSKVAKTLDVGLYRFVAYLIVAVFLAGGAWMLMGENIGENTLAISTHRMNSDVHLSTDNIISNTTMDNQVRMNTDNIKHHGVEMNRINGEQIKYIANQENLVRAVGTMSNDIKDLTKAINQKNGG